MQKFRLIKWFALGVAVLLVGAILGAALYTRTEDFQRWVRQEAVGAINSAIRGSLSIERLEGSVWRELTLFNTALSYEGEEIVRFPRLTISFSLLPLLWGEVRISAIDGKQPRAHLRQNQDGKWNLVEAVSLRQPDSDTDSAFAVFIGSLRLTDGAVDLRLASDKKTYRFERLQLESGIEIRPAACARRCARTWVGAGFRRDIRDLSLERARASTGRPRRCRSVLKLKNFLAVSRDPA